MSSISILERRCFKLGLIMLAFGNVMEMTPTLIITRRDTDERRTSSTVPWPTSRQAGSTTPTYPGSEAR